MKRVAERITAPDMHLVNIDQASFPLGMGGGIGLTVGDGTDGVELKSIVVLPLCV